MGATTFDFRDRHVLVTGGTRGLGRVIARAFARAGAQVTVTGTQSLSSVYAAPLHGFGYARLDLSDPDSIDRVAQEQPRLDVLVHAAGARLPRTSEPQEREFVHHSVRLGLVGPEQLTHRLRHRLATSTMRGGGSVVHTHHLATWLSLAHGPERAHDEMLASTTRMAQRLGADGIRVNCVASTVPVPRPGRWDEAGHMDDVAPETSGSGALLTQVRPSRTGTAQDLAAAVLFLGSNASAYITGQTLMVHGSSTGGARRK